MGPGGSCNELPGFYPSSDYLAKNYLTLPPFFSFFSAIFPICLCGFRQCDFRARTFDSGQLSS
jgi:hypothetical protein